MDFLRKLFRPQDPKVKVKRLVQDLTLQSSAVASSKAAWERFEKANPLIAVMGIPIMFDAPPPEFLAKLREKDNLELRLSNAKKKEGNVRAQAALSLGKLRDISAVQPLIAALGDEYKSVRKNAAQALGAIGDKSAMVPLAELAQKDSDADVRRETQEAMEMIQKVNP